MSGLWLPLMSWSSLSQMTVDLRILEQPILQNLFGTQRVTPMHQRDLGGKIGEKQRLLDGSVAAADHQHVLAAIEEAVAGGARGHTVAAEFLLRGQFEPARLRAGRQHQRVGEIAIAGIAFDPERAPGEIDFVDVIGNEPGADMGRLLGHLFHEPGPLDHIGEARVVLDVGCGGQLTAGFDALDQHRFEHGASGIDRRRVARRSRPDDEDFDVGGFRHRLVRPSVETGAEGTIARLQAP